MLERAIQFAAFAHKGQVDKAGQPYILHPLRVMMAAGLSPVERVAAVLHDVVEDGKMPEVLAALIRHDFGDEVAGIVQAVTKRPGEEYPAFIIRIVDAGGPAVRVKLADLRDNMNLGRLAEPTQADFDRYDKYARAVRRLEPWA